MDDVVEKTRNGAIVYDTALLKQISEAKFTAAGWDDAEPVKGVLRSAGRGNTVIVSDGETQFVLRHYLRGGLPGRLIKDKYLWTGESNTRSFREWRMLAKLIALGLPVPRPAAARYCRYGPLYTADLITVRESGIRSLAERIAERPAEAIFWQRLGANLHKFHAAGVFHADLNAYNVQIDQRDQLFLLDFDRGKFLTPGIWRQKNVARLHRSLRKIKKLEPRLNYLPVNWLQFLDGYFSASRSA